MPDSLLRVLACGSVDDGKSTLIGRLLFECGTIPDDVMAVLERDSRRFGTTGGNIDYALLVDGLAAERDQGITIDVAYRYFETPRRRFILADAPGHQQYTRNMVTGASNADLAIVLIDARKGVLDQTRRHAAIASMLGIRDVVLAVNKMDLVGFEQAVFERIVADFHSREAAEQAAQDWSRMFQKDETPEDLPVISVRCEEVAAPNASTTDGHLQVKLDKLLARTGLATSVSDGLRKVKQNAVRVDGELKSELVVAVKLGTEFTLRAGKKMVKVSVQG